MRLIFKTHEGLNQLASSHANKYMCLQLFLCVRNEMYMDMVEPKLIVKQFLCLQIWLGKEINQEKLLRLDSQIYISFHAT